MATQIWRRGAAVLLLPGIVLATGCNPVTTAVKIGVHFVGTAVADEQTGRLGQELMGRDSAAADARLGNRSEVWRDVNAPREWRVYPVKGDVMGSRKYVVEVHRDRIISVMMVEKGQRQLDLPRRLYYEEKLKGKTPRECRTLLRMGDPLMTVRNERTGLLGQIYDAQGIEGMGPTRYCILKFDARERCHEVNLIQVAASATR